MLCQHFSGIFDHEHRSCGPRNSFDDGDDESTFLKKGVKTSKFGKLDKVDRIGRFNKFEWGRAGGKDRY